jgi:hypothetical protein
MADAAPKPELHIAIELEPRIGRAVVEIAARYGETLHHALHRLLTVALLASTVIEGFSSMVDLLAGDDDEDEGEGR